MRFSITGNSAGERPVSTVPILIRLVLVVSLISQVVFYLNTSSVRVAIEPLPAPMSNDYLTVMSMGEPVTLSKLLMFWVQGFDHQPGVSIPFLQLNYDYLSGWLARVLSLDPDSHYALLSAARIYSEVPDDTKKRQMLDFVYKKFLELPDQRWPWMAHAVYISKHRIKDIDLALKYAKELRINTNSEIVPQWARQMEIFIYEDLGDLESARILLGGLIESGEIKDESEVEFLLSRLNNIDTVKDEIQKEDID
jgi:hypothetical protein